MRRREFITLLSGAAVVRPLAARAQQSDQMRRIGVLMGYAESDLEAQAWVTAFVQGFKELGWIVGRNVSIDYRFGAGDADRMRAYAEELVGLTPAVILAHTSPVMAALQQATRTIPIVFVDVFAPVGQRFVSNLACPGGNITGFSSVEPEIGGKWLGMLKEVVPLLARVAVVYNPGTGPFSPLFLRAIEMAAPSFAVKPIATPVHEAADIERAITAFAHDFKRRADRAAERLRCSSSTVDFRTGSAAPFACGLRVPLLRRRRWPDVLRCRCTRSISAVGGLCRWHPKGCQAWRASRASADQIPAGGQSQDREGTRPHPTTNPACHR